MKFIKKFEMFHSTGLDDGKDHVVPKYNPKVRKEVSDFLDDLPPSGKIQVLRSIGIKEEISDDGEFEKQFEIAKKKFIDFFENNTNLSIQSIDLEKFTIPGKSGDGIPRVQNIGGTSQTNSFRIGQ
jgi:hypothetical protein